jgi:beta-phosphoglucomutase-like phosphatase (HAD superfamily)
VKRPEAVVFDCDGVLVDSEPHSVAAWLSVLDDLDHLATGDDVESCTGLGFLPTWEHLNGIDPLPPVDEVWPRLLDALAGSFRGNLTAFPDAMMVLDHCVGDGVPVAVVSASPRERLDLTLRSAGLDGVFGVSISGDDVANGKPAPDGYAAAAAALAVDAAGCVAVEDSVAGITAALSAGMPVVAVVREEASRAALVATGAEVVDRLTVDAVFGAAGR